MSPVLPPHLRVLWGQEVVVTGPTGSQWRGRLIGYLDEPSVMLMQPDGSAAHCAASFRIEAAPPALDPDRAYTLAEVRYGTGWPAGARFRLATGEPQHVHPDTMPCNVMCPAHPRTVKRP